MELPVLRVTSLATMHAGTCPGCGKTCGPSAHTSCVLAGAASGWVLATLIYEEDDRTITLASARQRHWSQYVASYDKKPATDWYGRATNGHRFLGKTGL
jgi:hypothetical protein